MATGVDCKCFGLKSCTRTGVTSWFVLGLHEDAYLLGSISLKKLGAFSLARESEYPIDKELR